MPAPKKRAKINTQIGVVVRSLREASSLTQEDLAERADLSKNYVGSIERGEQDMRVSVLIRVAAALRIDASEIFKQSGY